MIEILFKAKRLDNGEWVEGYLFETREHAYIAYANQFDDDLFLSPQNIFIEVDANTICQYTGFNDNHGNKIWENDVLCSNRKEKYFVKWRFCGFELLHRACATPIYAYAGTDLYVNEHTLNLEVLGNIFDNPELLEGGGEDETD